MPPDFEPHWIVGGGRKGLWLAMDTSEGTELAYLAEGSGAIDGALVLGGFPYPLRLPTEGPTMLAVRGHGEHSPVRVVRLTDDRAELLTELGGLVPLGTSSAGALLLASDATLFGVRATAGELQPIAAREGAWTACSGGGPATDVLPIGLPLHPATQRMGVRAVLAHLDVGDGCVRQLEVIGEDDRSVTLEAGTDGWQRDGLACRVVKMDFPDVQIESPPD